MQTVTLNEQMEGTTFDALMKAYGIRDYAIWLVCLPAYKGYFWLRHYHDGAWLEGIDLQEVVYWGA